MPRKKKLTPDEARQHQENAFSSLVRSDGVGEDPAIQALQGFEKKTNLEAFEIALALQNIVRGQNSLLANQEKMSEQIAKMRKRMAEMDAQAEKWENDRQRFIDEVTARADRVRLTEAGQEQARAKAGIDLVEATRLARADITISREKYDTWLKTQPLETVVSPGKVVTVTENGAQVAKLIPEEVRIKHRTWIFRPGIPTDVPKPIADVLRSRRLSEEETRERMAVMAKNYESSELERRMKEIDAKYKSNGSMGAAEAAQML